MTTASKRITATFTGALTCIFIVALLASCGPGTEEPADSAGSEARVGIGELAENPQEYYGRTVTVSATVARVFEPGVFSLITDEPPADEEPIEDGGALVVSADGSELDLNEEETVRVSGEVQPLERSEIEQATGVNLNADLYAAYDDGQPVIIAESVEPLAGGETRGEGN